MRQWFDSLPFRTGTTSYIIPDDILPNVRYLADRVRDVELVLFDIDEYCNIPDPGQITELNRIAEEHGLSYTVHLPLDLNFSDRDRDISLEKAIKMISGTKALSPHAYVCHLESRDIPSAEGPLLGEWQRQRISAVNTLAEMSGIDSGLAVENLEHYPISWNEPVIRACGTHACLDIGHLFLQRIDPVPVIRHWLDITSVIHLHGIGTRDHQSLALMPAEAVHAVLTELIDGNYRGVLTLEIFNEDDLNSSLEMIRECL